MHFYFQSMKKNIFLCLMTVMILILTAGFWLGIPLFGLTEYFYGMNAPILLELLIICLTVGFCFSIFCIPFHLSFAKEYAADKKKNRKKIFLITQAAMILLVSLLFAAFYITVIFLAN